MNTLYIFIKIAVVVAVVYLVYLVINRKKSSGSDSPCAGKIKQNDWVTDKCTLACSYDFNNNSQIECQFDKLNLYICDGSIIKQNIPNITIPDGTNAIYSDYKVSKYDTTGPTFTTSNGNKYYYRQYIKQGEIFNC